MEKLIKKITKLLSKEGISDEKINSIVEDLNSYYANDEVDDEEEVEKEKVEESETPTEEVKAEDKPTEEETAQTDESTDEETPEDAEPTVKEEEKENSQVAEGVEGAEVPPTNDSPFPPSENPNDPNEFNPANIQPENEVPQTEEKQADVELLSKVENQAELITALQSKISALENALREGGILVDAPSAESKEVGANGTPNLPANSDKEISIDDVFNEINRKY